MIAPELWRRLRERDPAEVAARSLAAVSSEGRYELPMLGSRVWVDPQTQEVTTAWPEVLRPDYFLQVSAVQYLLCARAVPLAGELVPVAQLPYGEVFFRGPHALPSEPLGALFGSDGDRFRRVMARLGGEPADLADVGVRVEVFPRLPVHLGLWLADEEFPARVTFLFDRTAGEHLPVDALWSAVMVMADAVRRAAAQPET